KWVVDEVVGFADVVGLVVAHGGAERVQRDVARGAQVGDFGGVVEGHAAVRAEGLDVVLDGDAVDAPEPHGPVGVGGAGTSAFRDGSVAAVGDELIVVPPVGTGVAGGDGGEVGDHTVDFQTGAVEFVIPEVDPVNDRIGTAIRVVGEQVVAVRPEGVVLE